MKKLMCLFLTVLMLLMGAVSSQAAHHGGGRGGWGVWGPVVGLGLGVGLWELSHPYYYPYGRYYSDSPVIIQQQPSEVYIQAPEAAIPPAQEPVYWYYCPDAQGYYPYVKQCPKGWLKVVPTPPAGQ